MRFASVSAVILLIVLLCVMLGGFGLIFAAIAEIATSTYSYEVVDELHGEDEYIIEYTTHPGCISKLLGHDDDWSRQYIGSDTVWFLYPELRPAGQSKSFEIATTIEMAELQLLLVELEKDAQR